MTRYAKLSALALAASLGGCECGSGSEVGAGDLRLDSVEPDRGPTAGGTQVRLRGAGFDQGLVVRFGDRAATDLVVLTSTVAEATTPEGASGGLVDVVLELGTHRTGLPDGFEYLDGPIVESIEPAFGSVEGGTPVVVHGQGFVEGAVLKLGGGEAVDLEWLDASTLAATTPPGPPGFVDITVENPDGQIGTLPEGFEYRRIGCQIVAATPGNGASDVAITGSLEVELSLPIDPATVDGLVSLQTLSPQEGAVPVDVVLEGDRTLRVTPDHSLRFWRTYVLSVADGLTTTNGAPCEAASIAFATVVPAPGVRELRPASADAVALLGDVAITASKTYRGLQVYDVSDPTNAVLLSELLTVEPVSGLTVAGTRLYAPTGLQGVLIFDVSTPTQPQQIGRAGTPGYARNVDAFDRDGNQYLAVADGAEGVRILDVTDPEGVRDVAVVDPSGARSADVRAVDVEGNWLAVSDGTNGFELVDITNLEEPEILGRNWLGVPTSDVQIVGNVMYVAQGVQGMYSIDLTQPSTLPWLHDVYGPDGPCDDYCVDEFAALSVSADGNELLVAGGPSGVFRISIDGLGAMSLVGSVQTPGYTTTVVGTDQYLFASEEGGLIVYPAAVESDDEPVWFDPNGHGLARSLAISGDHAYVAAGTRGLQTLDLTNEDAPVLVDRDDTPGGAPRVYGAFAVDVAGSVLALGDGRGGLTLFDLTDAANPVQAGNLESLDRVSQMVVDGSTLFACADNWGVLIADISDAAAPVDLGGWPYADDPRDQCFDLELGGDLLYVASRFGITVLDVSDPSDPELVASAPLRAGDSVLRIALNGDILYASTYVVDFEGRLGTTQRLQAFDVSNPGTLERVFVSDELGGASGLLLLDDVLFLAAADVGVYVFDVHEPNTPALEGLVSLPGFASHLEASGDGLYVAQLQGGLQAVHTGPLPAP